LHKDKPLRPSNPAPAINSTLLLPGGPGHPRPPSGPGCPLPGQPGPDLGRPGLGSGPGGLDPGSLCLRSGRRRLRLGSGCPN